MVFLLNTVISRKSTYTYTIYIYFFLSMNYLLSYSIVLLYDSFVKSIISENK